MVSKSCDDKSLSSPTKSFTSRHHHPRRHNFAKKTFMTKTSIFAKNAKNVIFNRNRLPAIDWARNYNLEKFTGDCIAGLTTALTVIPQGIGYAPLAGLPLQVSILIDFTVFKYLMEVPVLSLLEEMFGLLFV
jgi:hypothetical protein